MQTQLNLAALELALGSEQATLMSRDGHILWRSGQSRITVADEVFSGTAWQEWVESADLPAVLAWLKNDEPMITTRVMVPGKGAHVATSYKIPFGEHWLIFWERTPMMTPAFACAFADDDPPPSLSYENTN